MPLQLLSANHELYHLTEDEPAADGTVRTRCQRTISAWHLVTLITDFRDIDPARATERDTLSVLHGGKPQPRRLCQRCGTPADFALACAENLARAQAEEHARTERNNRALVEARHQQAVRLAVAKDLLSVLEGAGAGAFTLRAGFQPGSFYDLAITRDGVTVQATLQLRI